MIQTMNGIISKRDGVCNPVLNVFMMVLRLVNAKHF